jgi:hypothetical protein
MGEVREQITLVNSGDVINAKKGIIKAADIHTVTVEAIVDAGALFHLTGGQPGRTINTGV